MEKVRSYNQSSLFRAGHSFHDAKSIVKEYGITLKGRRSHLFIEQQKYATSLAKEMQTEHKVWLNEKFQPFLSYLQAGGTQTRDEVATSLQEQYTQGLETTITLFSRATVNTFDVQDAITSYTAGFITMLKVCERLDVAPNSALTFAKKNYSLDARSVAKLFREYKNLPQSVITSSAIQNPRDPEGFLDQYLETVKRLLEDERYQYVSQSVIERIAVGNRNPEGFLDQYLKTVKRLSGDERYQSLPQYMITSAALNNARDPEVFLDQYLKTSR